MKNLAALGVEPPALSPEHRAALRAKGIGDAEIDARGYYTATSRAELRALRYGTAALDLFPALVLPVRTTYGHNPFCQIKPDHPRFDTKGRARKYEMPHGQQMVLDVPPICRPNLKDPRVPLWITEGINKADAAAGRGLCVVDLLSVTLHVGRNQHGAKTKLEDWSDIAWAGDAGPRTVYLAFDSDSATNKHVTIELYKLGDYLTSKGARILYVRIPSASGQKVGLDDFFAAGGTTDELIAASSELKPELPEASEPTDTGDDAGMARIQVNNRELRDVTEDAIGALSARNDPPEMFVRDKLLARVAKDENGYYQIQALGTLGVREALGNCANWVHRGAETTKRVWPPKDLAENILAGTAYVDVFPPLAGLAAAPVLSPGGTFYKERGYDQASRWFVTDKGPWETFQGSGADAAAWLLAELLGDFPFADQASAANALSLMVLPFIRSVIDGPTPMFFADAPRSRTGKGLVLDACLTPALGRECPRTPLPEKEEERAKLLYSLLSAGEQVIMFDNVKGFVSSASLEACLTSTTYVSRILGMTSAPSTQVKSIFTLTANNGKLSVDMAGRCVWIRLDARMENPEERSAFRHPKLLQWIRQYRRKIVGSIMAMVEHWVGQGSPVGEKLKSAPYGEFSAKAGGVLLACGVMGFLANERDLKGAVSEDDDMWRSFYQAWYARFGVEPATVKELRQLAEQGDLLDPVFANSNSEKGRATAFGRSLSGREKTALMVEVENGPALFRPEKSTMSAGLSRFKLVKLGGLVDFDTPPRVRSHAPAHTQGDLPQEVHQSTTQVQNSDNLVDSRPKPPSEPPISGETVAEVIL